MHIEYQITEDEFESAAWLALRKRSIPGAFKFYYFCGFTVLWIALAILPFIVSRTVHNFVECLLSASFGLAILSCQLLFMRFKFRRQYRGSAGSHLRTSFNIDGTGTRFTTQESDSRSSWQLYSKYAESESMFVLFPRGNPVFVPIPKRELTPAQTAELRAVIETHVARK